MNARRTALALATLALAALAHAQATPPATAEQLRDLVATRLNAVVITCPVAPRPGGPHYACYRIDSSDGHHRWQIELWLARFSDLTWASPWTALDGGGAMRVVLLTGADGRPDWIYGFSLIPTAGFETLVHVFELGAAE